MQRLRNTGVSTWGANVGTHEVGAVTRGLWVAWPPESWSHSSYGQLYWIKPICTPAWSGAQGCIPSGGAPGEWGLSGEEVYFSLGVQSPTCSWNPTLMHILAAQMRKSPKTHTCMTANNCTKSWSFCSPVRRKTPPSHALTWLSSPASRLQSPTLKSWYSSVCYQFPSWYSEAGLSKGNYYAPKTKHTNY